MLPREDAPSLGFAEAALGDLDGVVVSVASVHPKVSGKGGDVRVYLDFCRTIHESPSGL